ncbi:MICOS complex subunit [Venturia nashicola]|uniref:glucan 1,4-alpha-glucosidase n=1 Tax=Venturia nashicola TaxID=86259 RepID=A0A4Z1P1Q9_9PEZI|nr:MICOS complex subunit [Venturia nashicola]
MSIHHAFQKLVALLGFLCVFSCAQQHNCTPSITSTAPPADGSGVQLHLFSYCRGDLNVTAYIEDVNYDKVVTVYYTDRYNKSTPVNSIALDYISAVTGNEKWQIWSAKTPVYIDGITELLNITYKAVNINKVYSQTLHIPVIASGEPVPAPLAAPAPYATPNGFSEDVTSWLAVGASSQIATCKARMFSNINIKGAANGTVVASTSTANPDYHYNWVRDAALTMDVVVDLYEAATVPSAISYYEGILFQYSQARADQQQVGGLGEPKFYLNNTLFTGPWGRPQNDGPAEAAAALIDFATAYLSKNGSVEKVRKEIYDSTTYPTFAPVKRDLLYVAANWSLESFDLWEEESSYHFFNSLVSHRALRIGSTFALKLNDSDTASTLSAAADAVVAGMGRFWDENRQLILYEYGPVLKNKTSFKDIAVILGVLHGYADDDIFSYTNDQVLVSAYQIATSFLSVYPIAKVTLDSAGGVLGIPIGRYPEDVYNGTGTAPSGGNPWYLATTTMAELFYKATLSFTSANQILVTNTSLPFWTYFAPSASLTPGNTYPSTSPAFQTAIGALEGWADAFMRRVKFHVPDDGRLAEEYDRNDGIKRGAEDLTWSYASVITAAMARARSRKDTAYPRSLADLGFT